MKVSATAVCVQRDKYLAKTFKCSLIVFVDIVRIRFLVPFHLLKDDLEERDEEGFFSIIQRF